MNTLFDIPKTEPLPKERKERRKPPKLFTRKENNRRYELHQIVKKIEHTEVVLKVRQRVIEFSIISDLEDNKAINELITKFKYQAVTLFTSTT